MKLSLLSEGFHPNRPGDAGKLAATQAAGAWLKDVIENPKNSRISVIRTTLRGFIETIREIETESDEERDEIDKILRLIDSTSGYLADLPDGPPAGDALVYLPMIAASIRQFCIDHRHRNAI